MWSPAVPHCTATATSAAAASGEGPSAHGTGVSLLSCRLARLCLQCCVRCVAGLMSQLNPKYIMGAAILRTPPACLFCATCQMLQVCVELHRVTGRAQGRPYLAAWLWQRLQVQQCSVESKAVSVRAQSRGHKAGMAQLGLAVQCC